MFYVMWMDENGYSRGEWSNCADDGRRQRVGEDERVVVVMVIMMEMAVVVLEMVLIIKVVI